MSTWVLGYMATWVLGYVGTWGNAVEPPNPQSHTHTSTHLDLHFHILHPSLIPPLPSPPLSPHCLMWNTLAAVSVREPILILLLTCFSNSEFSPMKRKHSGLYTLYSSSSKVVCCLLSVVRCPPAWFATAAEWRLNPNQVPRSCPISFSSFGCQESRLDRLSL